MSRSTKALLIRLFTRTLFFIALYVLQSMVFSRLRILGAAPLILPVAVVAVALFEGPSWGGGFGIAAGLLCDISFFESGMLFTLLLPALGIGVGLLADFILTKRLLSFFLCCVAVLLIIAFLQMFPYLVFHRVESAVLLQTALLQTLYSALFAAPMYYISRKLCGKTPV